MHNLKLALCTLVGVVFFTSLAQARWAIREDAESEVKFFHRDLEIRADGTYLETVEVQSVIKKEGGRNSLATRPLVFNASGTKLLHVEGKSIHEGKSYPVPKNQIEKKPLATPGDNFDEYEQVKLAYPYSEIGSELYLKYKTEHTEAPLPGIYSTDFVFGQDESWLEGHIKVESEKPFLLAVNDPEKILDIKQGSKNGKYTLEIQTLRPVFKRIVDEPYTQINPKHLPYVSITTAKDWAQIGLAMATEYEKVISQSLPDLYKSIVDLAAKKTDFFGKINLVTSNLAERVKYLGDWRSVKGKYIPRDLDRIASTRLGDCKDYSVSTVAMLRKLGIKATVAAVRRGSFTYDEPNDIPDVFAFNHVMVKVEAPQDKVLWIDPTNFASYAQGTFADISNRWALLLSLEQPRRERIPAINPTEYLIDVQTTVDLDPKKARLTGSLTLKGGAAISMTGSLLVTSKESAEYSIVRYMADETRLGGWSVKSPDLQSRIVKDLRFEYEIEERGKELKTNAGPAFAIPKGQIMGSFLSRMNNRVSDLMFEPPSTWKRTIFLRNIKPKGNSSIQCSIKSPWLDAKRSFVKKLSGVEVSDTVSIKKSLIENKELQSAEFTKMQDQLEGCFDDVAIVYERTPGPKTGPRIVNP